MSEYDVGQYCLGGHCITQGFNRNPADREKFCSVCGVATINACQSCGAPIRGYNRGAYVVMESPRPNHCHECGSAHPWLSQKLAAASEMVELFDDLTPVDRSQIEGSLQDIASGGPRTELGVARLKKVLAKVGKGAADAIYKVAVDVASEAAKKMLLQ